MNKILQRKFLFVEIMFLFSGFVFYSPVAILIRTQRGISVSQFLILQAVLSLSIFFFEVPLGILTDRIGYKYSMISSQIFILIARILLLFANSFLFFILEAILEGIHFAFSSGTISSYVYVVFGEESYAKKSSILQNFSNLGFIISNIVFFFVYKYMNIDYLIIFTIISNLIALLFCFNIPKEEEIEEEDEIDKSYIINLLNGKTVGYMILSSIISLSFILINFFYVTIFEKIGFNGENIIFIILGYTAVELIIPKIIEIFGEKKLKKNIFLFSIFSSILFSLIGAIVNFWVIIPMIILPATISTLSFYIDKLENLYVDTISKNKRATILSLFSMGSNGLDVGFLFLSSEIIDNSFNNLFILISIVLFLIGLYFLLINYKFKES